MKKIKNFCSSYFPLSLRDWILFAAVMALGSAVCMLLQHVTETDMHVPIIFVLVVLLTALLTNGFFYGILASLTSVFAVNWAFTYPYMKLDFSPIGYPLTFITMLAVSIAASMLASGMKQTEKFRHETAAEKMRATLLRSVSHDLRTPLTGIVGSISAVLENKNMNEESKRELLINARDDAEWLYRIVENLLSVTKISGSANLHKVEELMEEVIGEAVGKFKKKHPEIRVSVRCPEEPLFILMDAMLIEQVLANLLDNSVIHGKSTDAIGITVYDHEKSRITVAIKDNGQGIDEEILPHLFDGSLEPGGSKTDDDNRFMGIGLAVCKTIIDAHGGEISAQNLTGGGAKFSFTLPKGANIDYSGQDTYCGG